MEEIGVNLWFLIDEGVGFVYALMGRAYMLSGTDEEKLRVLHSLASTDYLLAKKCRVPDNYTVIDQAGNARERLVDPQTVTNNIGDMYEQVFREIEKELPPKVTWRDGQQIIEPQTIPQQPIMVCTGLLEHEDGSITPLAKPFGV